MLRAFESFDLKTENPTKYYNSILQQFFKFVLRFSFEKTVKSCPAASLSTGKFLCVGLFYFFLVPAT